MSLNITSFDPWSLIYTGLGATINLLKSSLSADPFESYVMIGYLMLNPSPYDVDTDTQARIGVKSIPGAHGDKIQDLGERSTRITISGEFLYNYGGDKFLSIPGLNPTSQLQLLHYMKRFIRSSLPFFSSLDEQYRFVFIEDIKSKPILYRPGDIAYTIKLIQDSSKGFP